VKTDALAILGPQLSRGVPSLSFPGDGDFASRLTLGQIIKGRVLRSYEGQRYLVDFGGDRRVVDSAVPLRADEVFHGRVVGLGEQVQVHKLAPEATPPETLPPATGSTDQHPTEPLAALFARYRVALPAARVEAAAPVVARLQPAPLAALGAVVLAKLGLPLEPSLIRALHARLAGQAAMPVDEHTLRLDTAAPAATRLASAVPALAAALTSALVPAETARAGTADTGSGDSPRSRGRPRDAALHVFNVQTGGTVAHRLGVLPLVVDGRLIELEVALFDEGPADDGAAAAPPRHRQIVIRLDTASLGQVEIRARIAGSRMDLSLSTPTSEATQALSMYGAALTGSLQGLGFELDGLAYGTHAASVPGGPLQCTVEHIVNPGSVSRWV
jgi:hypothetical protein